MKRATKTRTALAILIAAALAVPASASAITAEQFMQQNSSDRAQSPGAAVSDVPATRTVESSSGFDWGDAGIGAAATLSLLGLGGGAVIVGRRARRRQPATS
jgi:hypothetical protein